MAQELTLLPAGWVTDPNPHSASPPGAASVFENVVIERRGIVQSRNGYAQDSTYSTTVGNIAGPLGEFGGEYYVWESLSGSMSALDFLIRRSDGAQVFKNAATDVGITTYGVKSTVSESRFTDAGTSMYLTTNDGVRRIHTTALPDGQRASLSGVPQGLTPEMTVITPASGGFLERDSAVAYRVVFQKNVNSIPMFGAPSGWSLLVRQPGAGPVGVQSVSLDVPIPLSTTGARGGVAIEAGDRVLVYRTTQTYVAAGGGASASPGDEMQLCADEEITATDITANKINIVDGVLDLNLGAFLYTNSTAETILQQNSRPPIAKDIATFSAMMFFADCQLLSQQPVELVNPEPLPTRQATNVTTAIGDPYLTIPGVPDENNIGRFLGALQASGVGAYTGDPLFAGSAIFPALSQITGVDVPNNRYIISKNAIASAVGPNNNCELHSYVAAACQGQIDDGVSPPYSSDIYFSSSNANGPSTSLRQFFVNDGDARETVQNLAMTAATNASRYFDIIATGGDDLSAGFLWRELSPFYADSQNDLRCEFFAYDEPSSPSFSPAMPTLIPEPYTFGSGLRVLSNTYSNRIYFSKQSIPEAVPDINFFDVGTRSNVVRRMIPVRNALLIFSDEGIYRYTGSSPFDARLDVLDPSHVLVHPDAACPFDNKAFAWTTQGVVSVTGAGVEPLSINVIQSQLDLLGRSLSTTTAAGNAKTVKTFAFSDESRDLVYLGLPEPTGALQYCTDVAVWSGRSMTWSKFAFTGRYLRDGIMAAVSQYAVLTGSDTADSRIYFQNGDNYDSTAVITVSAASGTDITILAGYSPAVGDAIIQGGVKYLIETVTSPTTFTVHAAGIVIGAATAYVGVNSAIQFIAKEAQNPGMLKHWMYVTPVFESLKEITRFFVTFYTNDDPTAITLNPVVPYSTSSTQRVVRLTPTRQHSRGAELVIKYELRTALSDWSFSGMSLTYNAGSTRVQR